MKPQSILETVCNKQLNEVSEMIAELRTKMNDPNFNKKLAMCKILNDNTGKRIKQAATALSIESENKKIENFFE